MPGNPLAVLVHSSEMVVPLLRKMSGHPTPGPPLVPAILTADVLTHTDRITAQPSRIAVAESATGPCLQATPLRMHGSADLAGAAQANGLIFLPAGRQLWGSGTEVQARVWWL
jgi:molybdopterin biosynthesis enzyme